METSIAHRAEVPQAHHRRHSLRGRDDEHVRRADAPPRDRSPSLLPPAALPRRDQGFRTMPPAHRQGALLRDLGASGPRQYWMLH